MARKKTGGIVPELTGQIYVLALPSPAFINRKNEMMKFRMKRPFEPWSKERTEAQIAKAEEERAELCRGQNDIVATIRYWLNEKKIIESKISNKSIYINQLKEQLTQSEWKEI